MELVPMRKKSITIVILATATILLLTSAMYFFHISSPPDIVIETYDNFSEAFSSGTFNDIDPYIHTESDVSRAITKDAFVNVHNEVLKWERIHSKLWVATVFGTSELYPNGEIIYHFVGMINNQWYVMLNVWQIPPSLQDNTDLSKYIRDNDLPPDTTVFPIY